MDYITNALRVEREAYAYTGVCAARAIASACGATFEDAVAALSLFCSGPYVPHCRRRPWPSKIGISWDDLQVLACDLLGHRVTRLDYIEYGLPTGLCPLPRGLVAFRKWAAKNPGNYIVVTSGGSHVVAVLGNGQVFDWTANRRMRISAIYRIEPLTK